MGKKKKKDKKIKKETITTKSHINRYDFTNGELYLRMNYLLKLAENVYKSKDVNDENNSNINHNILPRIYVAIMQDISKRNALHINKFVKKIICQKCNNLLFKDNNSEMKFINKNGKKTLQINCGECHYISEIIYF